MAKWDDDDEDLQDLYRMYAYRAAHFASRSSRDKDSAHGYSRSEALREQRTVPLPWLKTECPSEFPSRPLLLKPMLYELQQLGIADPESHTWVGRDRVQEITGAETVTMFCGCTKGDLQITGSRATMIYGSGAQVLYFPIFIAQCPKCGVIYWQPH